MAKNKKLEIGRKVGLGFLETVIHVIVYIIVIIFFIRAISFGYDFAYQIFGDPAMSAYDDSTIEFSVPEGSSMREVAERLEDQGLIKYALAFRVKAKLSGVEGNLVPGNYTFSKSMTGDEMLVMLTTQQVNNEDVQIGEDASGNIVNETAASEEETAAETEE